MLYCICMKSKRDTYARSGKVQQRLMLLLWAGLALGLTHSPRNQWRIIGGLIKEFSDTPSANVQRAVNSLYKSKLVSAKKNSDGSHTLVLSDRGKKHVLRYNLRTLRLKKAPRWDGRWRVVLYDVPEAERSLRVDLCHTLHRLGFYELQHSVWVYPYECRDEIEFLIEAHDARGYIRHMVVEEIDDSRPLLRHFHLRHGSEKA